MVVNGFARALLVGLHAGSGKRERIMPNGHHFETIDRRGEQIAALRCQRDDLLKAAKGAETIYAGYMALKPNPISPAFDLVIDAIKALREAIRHCEEQQ